MRNLKIFVVPVLAIAGTLASYAPVIAQVSSEDWKEVETLRSEIRADRQAVVAHNLELTEAEGPAFWPIYREYRMELDKQGDRVVKLIANYDAKYETMTDADAEAFFKEWLDIEKQKASLRDKYVGKFKKVLPAKKVARYFQIENKLDAIVNLGITSEIPLVP